MTPEENSSSNQKKSKEFSLRFYALAFGLLIFALVFFDAFHWPTSGRQLLPLSILAISAGLIFENIRLTEKWSKVLYTVLGSFVISFFLSIIGEKESAYDFENHIKAWQYFFIVVFTIISVFIHDKKLIPVLSEGVTLIQSIAFVYWIIDHDFFNNSNPFLKIIISVGLLFPMYSFIHAFSYKKLTHRSRLILSIWSSIIMVFFAIDNIYSVCVIEDAESAVEISDYLYDGLVYFLLGVSTMYIVKNILLLISFYPEQGEFFNSRYYRRIKKLKKVHVNRYSNRQVKITHSFLCVLFAGMVFSLNHFYHILPGNIAIWIVFVVFPFIVMLFDFISNSKTAASSDL